MTKLWFCLRTEKSKEAWAWLVKDITGKDWVPPEMSGVSDIESLKEITELIKEKSNYTVDKQGREE